jgi:hypothetical protein
MEDLTMPTEAIWQEIGAARVECRRLADVFRVKHEDAKSAKQAWEAQRDRLDDLLDEALTGQARLFDQADTAAAAPAAPVRDPLPQPAADWRSLPVTALCEHDLSKALANKLGKAVQASKGLSAIPLMGEVIGHIEAIGQNWNRDLRGIGQQTAEKIEDALLGFNYKHRRHEGQQPAPDPEPDQPAAEQPQQPAEDPADDPDVIDGEYTIIDDDDAGPPPEPVLWLVDEGVTGTNAIERLQDAGIHTMPDLLAACHYDWPGHSPLATLARLYPNDSLWRDQEAEQVIEGLMHWLGEQDDRKSGAWPSWCEAPIVALAQPGLLSGRHTQLLATRYSTIGDLVQDLEEHEPCDWADRLRGLHDADWWRESGALEAVCVLRWLNDGSLLRISQQPIEMLADDLEIPISTVALLRDPTVAGMETIADLLAVTHPDDLHLPDPAGEATLDDRTVIAALTKLDRVGKATAAKLAEAIRTLLHPVLT